MLTALLGFGVVASAAVGPSPAGASGPPLDVATATLAAALRCHGDLSAAGPTPVLLVPGTTLTPEVNFSWNYEQVFSAAGRPWCAVRLPNHGMSDAQVAGEYVVYGIRTMSAAVHRRISVVGFSQGGMVPRWALKWWPDTRAMVDDLVGIDPSNHGTVDAVGLCLLTCAPSFWQQRTGSAFLHALNAGGETWGGISYTQVYSDLDEVVVPNFGPGASSALHTGDGAIANISAQSICPVHLAEHLVMGTIDPVAYAVVLDALTHAGPARSSRVARSVCLQLLMPGVAPAAALKGEVQVGLQVGTQVALYPHVAKEPRLAAYASG
jgi:hypothetical protein